MDIDELIFDEDYGEVVLQLEDEDTISETTGEEQSDSSSGTCELSQEEDSLLEAPTNLTVKERLVEITSVSYRDFSIKVFIDSLDPRQRFFFEPIVLLDRKHIAIETYDLFQQDVIRFTVQMWTQELHLKVLERLKSIPEFRDEKIDEDDIHVLPFDEVHLVYKPGSIPESVQLYNQPICYARRQKYLHFYLLTNSASAALALSEDFHQNPEFVLKKWQLNLVGRGLAIGKAAKVASPDIRPVFSFNVTTNIQPQFQGAAFGVVPLPRPIFNEETGNIVGSGPWKNVVPVFSVKKSPNPQLMRINGTVTFSVFNFVTKAEHGYFHLENGVFFVATPGTYQFHFNGLVIVDSQRHYARVDLRVNGVTKAYTRSASCTEAMGYQPMNLSALVTLDSGDRVDIGLVGGEIHEFPSYVTQFEGVLFAN